MTLTTAASAASALKSQGTSTMTATTSMKIITNQSEKRDMMAHSSQPTDNVSLSFDCVKFAGIFIVVVWCVWACVCNQICKRTIVGYKPKG